MDFKDYYTILGIKKGASDKEIKSAFKQLAKQHHPDASGGSEEKFKEINEAYEVLKDSTKKARYDFIHQSLKQPGSGFDSKTQGFRQSKMYSDIDSFRDFYNQKAEQQYKQKPESKQNDDPKAETNNFSDFFEMFFGKHKERTAGTNQETKAQAERGDDFEMEIELSLEDAYHGCVKKIEISSGATNLRRLEVSIPSGVRNGTKIKVANEGKPGKKGGSNGDLFLKVKLKEHDVFWIEGDDIHSEIILKPQEAVLGCTQKIPTIEDIVELVIPPQTHSGRILRLRSKGLKSPSGSDLGDHYVHIKIDIPDELSDEELTTYKYLKELSDR